MSGGSWRVARVGGVGVYIHPSLLVVGAVLVFLYASRFDDGGQTSGYVSAGLFVVGLYFTVFLHELAHLIAARAFRLRVRSITLHLLGGETDIDGPNRTPIQEFVISVAGPMASLAIGFGCLFSNSTSAVVYALGWVNIVIGVFNLLPGLPLDGGRALRALVWQVTGRLDAGTRLAGWAGRLIAVGLVVVTLLQIDFSGSSWSTNLAFSLLVAWFLWEGASHALATTRRGPA